MFVHNNNIFNIVTFRQFLYIEFIKFNSINKEYIQNFVKYQSIYFF